MEKIQMVDLLGQYLKIKNDIDDAIRDVIYNTSFINGPEVQNFKEELALYLGVKYVIPCGNGTDAIQIALMALDLNPGDEVIVPDFTFVATAEAPALLGYKPVFVDVDPDTFLLDVDSVEKAITPKTRAIIPVHLYGQCANMQKLMEIAYKNSIYIIEDNAQAIGAEILLDKKWVKASTVGHIGCLSFFPSKNLGAYGDGGAIVTNNPTLGERLAKIANHGSKIKYQNDLIGVNSRLDSMQAAILSVKLKKIEEYNNSRQNSAVIYNNLLADIPEISVPKVLNNSTHVYHQYTIKSERRNELKEYLASMGIPSMIYYPIGMHNQLAYKSTEQFPVSDMLCDTVLSLPMHTELTLEQQQYIANAIRNFYMN